MRLSRLTSLPGIYRQHRLWRVRLLIGIALVLLVAGAASDRATLAAGRAEAWHTHQRSMQESVAAHELLDPLPSATPTDTPTPTSTPANTATATDIPTWPSLPPSETPTPGGATVTPTPGAQAPESTAPPEPTPRPLYFSSVITGRFFPSQGNCKFLATPATPVVFTQQFPVIAFNPSDGTGIVCVPPSGVNKNTHPFTDVVPGTPGGACTTIATQAGATASDPFYAVFTGLLHVPASGQFVFSIYSDDGWILGMGPRVGGQGEKPSRVTGTFEPGVPPSPEPWPTTVFEQYQIVGRWDDMTWGGPAEMRVTVDFPAAGDYPFELDYTECAGGDLSLVWGSEQGKPIPVGPSPTPTATPTSTPVATDTPTPLPPPPKYTTSYYIQQNDAQAANGLGCAARARKERGIAVLNFGVPQLLSTGEYGTKLYDTDVRVTRDQIKAMVIAFAQGYLDADHCSGPGPTSAPNLVIAVGTNNSALQNADGIWHDNEALTAAHGTAWAEMIDDLTDEFIAKGLSPATRIAAAYDAEYYQSSLADCRDAVSGRRGCNGPVDPKADHWTRFSIPNTDIGTEEWANGYSLVENQGNHTPFYNFGSCEDCRRDGYPGTPNLGTTPSAWSTANLNVFSRVYTLTWQLGPAVPLPQIYVEPYAYEWYNVQWYAHTVKQDDMIIAGAMTQCGSSGCLDNNITYRLNPRFDVACHPQATCVPDWSYYNCGACPNFPPSQGWQAITDMLSSPNRPDGTPNPDLPIQFGLLYGVTDIKEQGQAKTP